MEVVGAACLYPLRSLHGSSSPSEREVGMRCVGEYLVYCTIWPSPKVKKGEVVCNSALVRGMLGHHRAVYDGGVVLVVPREDGVLEVEKGFDSCIISLSPGILSLNRNNHDDNSDDGSGEPAAGTPLLMMRKEEDGNGSLIGGDTTPMSEGTRAGGKKKKKKNTKSPHIVQMSPSMRRTLHSTPQEKKPAVSQDHDVVSTSPQDNGVRGESLSASSRQLYDTLLSTKRGKMMDMMLRSVIVRHVTTVGYIMSGNYYSFRFLDVPLSARIQVSSRDDNERIIVHQFDASCDNLTIQIESDESKDSGRDVGYAQDAVDAISKTYDENVSQTVFKSAFAGYISLESLKDCSDITGVDGYVDALRNWVSFPLKHYRSFCLQGAHPPTGVLLHGPPGTGKTLLARWVARDSDAKLFIINGSELMSEFLGESEKCLSAIFRAAVVLAPSVCCS